MRGTLHFVEHQAHQAVAIDVVARLHSFQPTRFLTAEGALAAGEQRPPDFLLTDLLLPGQSGAALLRAAKARDPKTLCVLLSSLPPGLSPRAMDGIDAVIVRRGAWGAELSKHLGAIEDEGAARLLAAIDRGPDGFDELAELALGDPLALRYLAAMFDVDRVLSVLERVRRSDVSTLEVALQLGAAGFGAVQEIATSPDAALEVRARAMRHLARAFPHEAVMAVLQGNLQDPSARVRLDAAHAAFASASRVGERGSETLREIAEAEDLPEELRIAALDRAARDLPRAAVKPMLVRALASGRPAIVHAASTLAMRRDGVDVEDRAKMAADGPLPARMTALEELARDFPKDDVLPVLARFFDGPPELQPRAFELAMSRAHTGFEPIVARAAAAGMLQPALVGALRLGPAGFGAVAAIAKSDHSAGDAALRASGQGAGSAVNGAYRSDRSAALRASGQGAGSVVDGAPGDIEVRAKAVRLLGVRFPAAESADVLAAIACGDRFALAEAALLAAVQLGPAGFSILKAAQSAAPIPAARELALIHLEEYAPDLVFKPALQRALRDDDVSVRARAIELWMRRLGGEFAPLLDRVAKAGIRELQEGALAGAMALAEGGFTALCAIALRAELEPTVRRRAMAALVSGFEEEEIAEVRAEFEQTCAPDSGPGPGPGPGPGSEAESEPDPASTPPTINPISESAPVRVPVPVRVPLSESAPVRVPLFESAPVRVPLSESAPVRVPVPVPVPSSESVPSGPTDRADIAIADRSGAGAFEPAEADRAPTGPMPPARPEPPDEKRGQIDLSRARKALEAAILLGRDGYNAIRALADSRRVPDEVRIQALRRLAGDFPDGDVAPVLEKALADRSFGVQNAALGCAMPRKDTRFEPIAELAIDPGVDAMLRIRAVRFLAARFEREKVKPILEQIFEEPDVRVRRAALECMFTSLKFVHPDRVEAHLINLLTEHHSAEIKAAAARALGAFGKAHALHALDRFTGLFAAGAVKDAALHAAARIRERLRPSRSTETPDPEEVAHLKIQRKT